MEEITQRLTSEITRTADQLVRRHPAFEADERFIHDRLGELAYRAYQRGADEALLSLRDSQQAAEELGITVRQIRAYASTYGLGWKTARDWVFLPSDIDIMRSRRGQVGRPKQS